MIMQMERWNPWWTGDPDPAYVAWSRLKVRWVPDESEQVSLKPFSLNCLRPEAGGQNHYAQTSDQQIITTGKP
jgi:hypothetical protein